MPPPQISVITAAKNVAASIGRLHESLEAQTFRDFEWVVVDAVSTDGTVALLNDYAGRSPWLRFQSEHDFGLYDALNKGIRVSRGRFYVVAGADDFFAPDALARFADIADSYDLITAYVDRGGRRIGGFRPDLSWIGPPSVFRGSHSVGMLIRRSMHDRFGFYSARFPLLADAYFLKSILGKEGVRIHSENFVAGTFSEGGMTSGNQLQILAETWQIQMLTEKRPLFQIALYLCKVLLRLPKLLRELHGWKMRPR